MGKPLSELSEDGLREELRRNSQHVIFSYNDVVAEMDRRSNRRLTRALVASTVIYTILTGILVAVVILQSATA